jgi:uncharacterized protein (DUF1330 family)
MVHITQLIYLQEGQEAVFEAFEAVAIPLIADHGGELLLRLRPAATALIAGTIAQPYEVHVVAFPSEEAFTTFMNDERRQAFLHLKAASIHSAVLIKGQVL